MTVEECAQMVELTGELPSELISNGICPDCGKTLQMAGGCPVCFNCGWSKCG